MPFGMLHAAQQCMQHLLQLHKLSAHVKHQPHMHKSRRVKQDDCRRWPGSSEDMVHVLSIFARLRR